ncbi:ankyrin repeat domain-containing protein [Dyella psychrodurans]|uniref:Ankyrin repeat domain-containing protein n=1 Tax=Dyella psychrodurans TaxID=1927960 RepID=A0A370XCC0_9GAMM|nr:ankyrin repeat domain-containing protein [Dyella psychrodurans]RDS85920.1 ankyrin repeat domain-containing protein [Dyella psychrodurans]
MEGAPPNTRACPIAQFEHTAACAADLRDDDDLAMDITATSYVLTDTPDASLTRRLRRRARDEALYIRALATRAPDPISGVTGLHLLADITLDDPANEPVRVRALTALLDAGGDPFRTDVLGRSALHCATAASAALILDRLTPEQRRALVNQADDYGDTPLHEAAACGHADTIQLLIAHGADATACNIAGATPEDAARRFHPAIADLIRCEQARQDRAALVEVATTGESEAPRRAVKRRM